MKLSDLYWFLGTFIIIYLFYLVFQVLRHKKINKKRVPVELVYLIKNVDKIKYTSIMNKIALVSAFDISFIATFVMRFIDNVYLAILLGGVLFIPLIMITYSFIGMYYQKKGLIKDGDKKD